MHASLYMCVCTQSCIYVSSCTAPCMCLESPEDQPCVNRDPPFRGTDLGRFARACCYERLHCPFGVAATISSTKTSSVRRRGAPGVLVILVNSAYNDRAADFLEILGSEFQ